MTDVFEQLAVALRAQWATRSDDLGHAPPTPQQRNLLLDACGSDHRPLVDLVLAVGDDVRAALPTAHYQGQWETQRAPLVHRLVASRYLQPDVARWLVDVWAFATERLPDMPTAPSMQLLHDTALPLRASDALTKSAAASTATSPQLRAALRRRAASASALPLPSGVTASFGVVTPTARAWRSARRGPMTPAELARIKRIERISLIVLAVSVVIGFGAEGYALRSRPADQFLRMPAAEFARRSALQAASRERALADSMVAWSAVVDTNPTARIDSVGRAWIGSVAGRYVVTHQRVSVNGSDDCDRISDALAMQQRTVETVEQGAGSSRIRLATRNVSGMVEPDGRFATGPDSGVTDGVRWTFTMSGRFTATGFSAQVQKTTDETLAWHKERSCAVIAEVTGTRIRG